MRSMDKEEFEKLVAKALDSVPLEYAQKFKNIAILVEDEPSREDRMRSNLQKSETLLGLYKGVPQTARGDNYGVGMTMPDTITLYRLPILEVAEEDGLPVEQVVKETVWHEVAHYFGMDEAQVHEREEQGTNRYD